MPVIQIFAPEAGDIAALATRVADDVSHALGLGVGDVIATFIPVTMTAHSGGRPEGGAWPVVSFHGGRRADDITRSATAAAEAAVRDWAAASGLAIAGVWIEWVTPGLEA